MYLVIVVDFLFFGISLMWGGSKEQAENIFV